MREYSSDTLSAFYPEYFGEASFAPVKSDTAPYQPVLSPTAGGLSITTGKGMNAASMPTIFMAIGLVVVALFSFHALEKYL